MRIKLFISLILTATALSVLADEDYQEAYRLRSNAEIMSLEEIVKSLKLDPADRILEVESEFEHGVRIYELEIRTRDGHIEEIEVDATTGRILERERD